MVEIHVLLTTYFIMCEVCLELVISTARKLSAM